MPSAASIFMAANTPEYLLRNLLKCDEVDKLSRKSTQQLFGLLLKYNSIVGDLNANEKYFLYLVFAALAKRPEKDRIKCIKEFKTQDEWLLAMRRVYLSRVAPGERVNLSLGFTWGSGSNANATISSSVGYSSSGVPPAIARVNQDSGGFEEIADSGKRARP